MKSQTIAEAKAQMTNEAQDPGDKAK